jgi:hypothetical protein
MRDALAKGFLVASLLVILAFVVVGCTPRYQPPGEGIWVALPRG